MKKLKIHPFIYFFFTILYLEIISKIVITNHLFNLGLIYVLVYSLPFCLFFTLLSKSFFYKMNKIISIIITLVITIYFEVQYIFYNLFSIPFSFSTISLANQALDFSNIIKDAILDHLLVFSLYLIPLIILIILNRKIDFSKYHKESIISLFFMLITSYIFTFLTLIPSQEKKDLYFKIDDQISIIDSFGMLTYTKIDLKRQIWGYDTDLIIEAKPEEKEPTEIEYGDNILDLNLSETNNNNINKINNYVTNSSPTNKNKYTGLFKDKNLIFILAEGFNEIAVDETRTPTLYKMVNNGFVFNNFYSPVFLSTTGGEFQATTGLIPTQEILSTWKKKTPKISYALGNTFSQLGYRIHSYHNWTYTYYKRNITMKTLGFTNYLGCGNGLEDRIDCGWLPQDSKMIEVTTPDYLNKEGNFVTYYVTVSGHSPYNSGDNIARIHLDSVKDLTYSDSVKYYLAAQVELDKMLEELIKDLEESGELDNTVIALVGDHYPYTLSIDEMNEAATYEKDDTIEVNHSNFILWNNQIEEPIVIDKVGSQIDVLPTILNLFGIDYDSRLIVGKDILSDYEGLAIFSNRSWTSDYGSYDSSTKTFTLKEGKELKDETIEEYVTRINNRVANSFSISKLIIDNNYYEYILGS